MCGLPAGAIAAAAAGCLLRRRLDLIRCRRCGPNDITHKRTQAYTPVHTHTHTHKRLLWRLADFIIFVFLSAFRRRRRRRRDAQSFGRHHHSIRPALRCDRSAKLFVGVGCSEFFCVCVCVFRHAECELFRRYGRFHLSVTTSTTTTATTRGGSVAVTRSCGLESFLGDGPMNRRLS